MLRCRTIKPGLAEDGSDALRVLSVDYSVSCGTDAHHWHYKVAIACLIMAAALPAIFIYKLRPRRSSETAEAPDIRYYVSAKLAVSVEEAEEANSAGYRESFALTRAPGGGSAVHTATRYTRHASPVTTADL